MNQKQTDFAVKRAEAIFANRMSALKDTHRIPAIRLTKSEKLMALSTGAFTVPEERFYWHESVVFDAEREESMGPGFAEASAALTAQKNRLVDQLMLGSTSEALVLLDAFSRGEDLPA